MKLYNKSQYNLSHGKEKLLIGETREIPDNIAKIWLTFPGVVKYIAPEDIEALKKENEKLKAQVKDTKKTTAKKQTKKAE